MWWTILLLVPVLVVLFARSLQDDQVLFSNDGPLGANMAKYAELPEAFSGLWQDLTWVGGHVGSAFPSLTYVFMWLLKPVGFAKFYTPLTILFLGLSAWLFFRQLGFRPLVCLLGGLAAALNTDFFSYACWGLGTLTLTVACTFTALAAVAASAKGKAWLCIPLAGLAVGMGVMEGFDNGAILSLYVASFLLFQALLEAGTLTRKLVRGLGRIAIVALFAAFIATQALMLLIGTQIKGVVGMEQDAATRATRWSEATQWSFPRLETLRVVIPGLFGYRMDTPEGGNYWGSVGQGPGLERFSGSGEYAGVLVVLIAAWALVQSFRKKANPFTAVERKFIWFWAVAALVSILLAFGRFAPFYQFFYALPYFSTIRNPIKFMHPFSLAVVILFGYGIHGLYGRYLENATAKPGAWLAQLKGWWATAPASDKNWVRGSIAILAIGLLGWLRYATALPNLERHLQSIGFPGELGASIARFSLGEVGWSVFFLALAVVLVAVILSGILAGSRARWGALALGVVLVWDMGRANLPWIVYWNYLDKYATNPIIDILRDKPYEHRVQILPFQLTESFSKFQQLYGIEWTQHLFLYYNIQALDVIQEPRVATDNAMFRATFQTTNPAVALRLLLRKWELTNTRFLLGPGGDFIEALNQQLDPGQRRFRLHTAFDMAAKHSVLPGKTGLRLDEITVAPNTNGPLALIQFTGALPRAKLYAQWQASTNDQAVLERLADPGFDPAQTVLVSNALPAPALPPTTNQNAGTVEFAHYSPKFIQLKAEAKLPSVLLLNDKFDSNWKVWVDGQPSTVLRCNFLMRGVFLQPGQHQVEFRFQPPVNGLYVSLAAIGLGLALCGLLAFSGARSKSTPATLAKNAASS
jgi:hypothetical protein